MLNPKAVFGAGVFALPLAFFQQLINFTESGNGPTGEPQVGSADLCFPWVDA